MTMDDLREAFSSFVSSEPVTMMVNGVTRFFGSELFISSFSFYVYAVIGIGGAFALFGRKKG